MKGLMFLLSVWIFFMTVQGALSQQFMLVESRRSLKNFKYYPGDDIRLKLKFERRMIEGDITCLTDSSVCIGSWEEVRFEDIQVIYRHRGWVLLSRGFFLIAGTGYFAIDSFNRLINDDSPVILAESAIIGGGLVGLNFLMIPIQYRRLRTDNWKISMLDFGRLAGFPY